MSSFAFLMFFSSLGQLFLKHSVRGTFYLHVYCSLLEYHSILEKLLAVDESVFFSLGVWPLVAFPIPSG